MMFIIHAAFALGLLTLTASSALYFWASNTQFKQRTILIKSIAFVVMLVSTLSVIGTFYLGIKIWKEIYFLHLVQIHHAEKQNEIMTQLAPVHAPKAATHHKK